MRIHADKQQENRDEPAAAAVVRARDALNPVAQFMDQRPATLAQKQLVSLIPASKSASRIEAIQEKAHHSPQARQAAQIQAMADAHAARRQVIQHKQAGVPSSLQPVQRTIDDEGDREKVHEHVRKLLG